MTVNKKNVKALLHYSQTIPIDRDYYNEDETKHRFDTCTLSFHKALITSSEYKTTNR